MRPSDGSFRRRFPAERAKARYDHYKNAANVLADLSKSEPLLSATDGREVSKWGLRLATSTEDERNQLAKTKYRGGMRVLDVTPDSPGAKSGIRKGDILVGLGRWETTTPDNLIWIMNQLNHEADLHGFDIKRSQFLFHPRARKQKEGLLPILPDSPAKELNN